MLSFSRLRPGPRVLPRTASFVLWGLAFGCAAYWALQMGQAQQAPSTVAATGFAVTVDGKQVAKLLGQQESAPVSVASSRYELLGVVRHGSAGAALISVDGKPARTVLVGRAVAEGSEVTLAALGARTATLKPKDGEVITLDMPALASAFTNTGMAPSAATPPASFAPSVSGQPQPSTPQVVPSAGQAGQSGQTARLQTTPQFGHSKSNYRGHPRYSQPDSPDFQASAANMPGAQSGASAQGGQRVRPGALLAQGDASPGSQVVLRNAAAGAAGATGAAMGAAGTAGGALGH
jgi:hypothetical protein